VKEARPWLIEDIIGAGDTVLLSGRIDAAKTTVALGWAMAVATGHPWRERPVTRGSVLYLGRPTKDGEKEMALAAYLYLRTIASGQDLEQDNIPVTVVRSSRLDLTPRPGDKGRGRESLFDLLEWHREKYGSISLVVIDTIADYFHGDLFDPEVVHEVVAVVDAISMIFGCAVVLVWDVEQGDAPAKETLKRLAKAADVHYTYRVGEACQANPGGESLHGQLVETVSGGRDSRYVRRFRADFSERQKSKARV
jgi:RecA-family ATPase